MADENSGKLQPTIVKPPSRPAKAAPAPRADTRPEVAAAPLRPTAVKGVQRERLAVSAEDLRTLSPGAKAGIVDRAQAMLAGVVLERTGEGRAILWGHELQKAHGERVAETLGLAQLPVIAKVQGHVARMLDILGSFDLMAAAEPGGIGHYFRSVNGKIDTAREIAAARAELDQLMRLLMAALDELLALRSRLESNADAIEALAADIEAAALAALFLAEHTQPSRPGVAACFTERAMSLTQTLAQIRGHGSLRDRQLDVPIRMVGAIQNVTLVSMPDFLAGLAAIQSLGMQAPSLSPTQARELNYKLQDIVRQLRP